MGVGRFILPLFRAGKYYDLVDQMKQKRQVREDIVNDTMRQLTKALSEAHIKADIKGRPKHFYSIYKKMKRIIVIYPKFMICLPFV